MTAKEFKNRMVKSGVEPTTVGLCVSAFTLGVMQGKLEGLKQVRQITKRAIPMFRSLEAARKSIIRKGRKNVHRKSA